MWSPVTFSPSSVRSRFSSRIFRLYGQVTRTVDGVEPVYLVAGPAHGEISAAAEAVPGHDVLASWVVQVLPTCPA